MDDNIMKKNNTIHGTTCFTEHKRYKVECKRTECRYWQRDEHTQNCTLISAEDGPKTLQEIGDIFGVTRMRICQIEKLIFKKLIHRKMLEDQKNH